MKKIGKGSWEQFWLTYKNKPGSLAVLICVILAAAITVGVLFSLIIYILVNGVPYILSRSCLPGNTTQANMSMMPAIISTVYHDSTVSSDGGSGRDIFGHLSGGIRQEGQQTGQSYPDDDGNSCRDPVDRVRPVRIYSVRHQPLDWSYSHAGRCA